MNHYLYHWVLWDKTNPEKRLGPGMMLGPVTITDPKTIATSLFAATCEMATPAELMTITSYSLNVSFLPANYSEPDRNQWIAAIRQEFNNLFLQFKKRNREHNKKPL